MSLRTPALFAAALTLAVIAVGCGSSAGSDDASKSTTT